MPSGLVTALSAPLREVQALVGPGWSGAGGPAATLSGLGDTLAGVSAAGHAAWRQADDGWAGAGAGAAGAFSAATAAAVTRLAERTGELGDRTRAAGLAVDRARARLQQIVDAFDARAAALEADVDTPGVAEELRAEARRALREAVSVIEDLRAELDGQAAAVAVQGTPGGTATSAPAPTVPAGFGGGMGGMSPAAGAAGGGAGAVLAAARPRTPRPDSASFGEGAAVTLPDGSTTTAPNRVAADAVRHALTQLGVPYQWGGTAPGVGLDCSGLTQWAYREAGLEIPRLAQEQDVGAAVAPGELRPGDLAVWSGHVAMVVGDGVMVEAGDPVQLSAVRTTNAGQAFHGFFRPTG